MGFQDCRSCSGLEPTSRPWPFRPLFATRLPLRGGLVLPSAGADRTPFLPGSTTRQSRFQPWRHPVAVGWATHSGAGRPAHPTSIMPQGDYIELARKRHGYRLDHHERTRKAEARAPRRAAAYAHKVTGIKAKIHHKRRYAEKAAMKKTLALAAEKSVRRADKSAAPDGAVPAYLLDREAATRSKVLSNTIKQKRKEKGGKWDVPLPRVKPVADDEVFKVIKTGKRKAKQWKRMVTKATFVGEGYTRKPPKYERFIRPTGMRFTKAHVTHPELKTTFCCDLLGVKKNPQSTMYTQLGVITKGTIVEVNVSDLGLVTNTGKVAWGKLAQVTNNPENDGCINAVLIV